MAKKFMTSGQVARLLGVSIPTIHRWVKNKEIPGIIASASKQLRFDETVIRTWITSQGWAVIE